MPPKSMQMRRFPIPQYDAELVLLHGTAAAMASVVATGKVPVDTFRDFVEAPDERIYGATSAVCGGNERVRRVVFVFIEASQKPSEKRLTIVHEMFHAVVRLMADIGHKISVESDEAPAYLLEWSVKVATKACGLR